MPMITNKMIVAYRNGTPVRIQDIGRAIENFQNNKILGQYVDDKWRPSRQSYWRFKKNPERIQLPLPTGSINYWMS